MRLVAGKSKRASLNFEVKGNTGVNAAKLQLSVWDGEFATGFSDELEIDFGEPKQVQKARGVVESKVDVTVYSGASAKTNPLGTLKSGARVRATMKTGGFTRVVLGKDAFGFIDSNALKSAEKASKETWIQTAARPGTASYRAVIASTGYRGYCAKSRDTGL